MTEHRSFKRLVRTRMAKTGESYTAARAVLLAGREPEPDGKPLLVAPDEVIRRRTGRGWEEWFDLLDREGLAGRPHRDISRWVADFLGVVPLAWPAQAVTKSYERIRGGLAIGEHEDGFAVTASRTVAVPVERLYDAFVDPAGRDGWMPDAKLRERTATRPRSARFDWADDGSRVHVTFVAKGDSAAVLAVQHARLADATVAATMKAWWRERLAALKAALEDGGSDA